MPLALGFRAPEATDSGSSTDRQRTHAGGQGARGADSDQPALGRECPGVSVTTALPWGVSHAEGRVTRSSSKGARIFRSRRVCAMTGGASFRHGRPDRTRVVRRGDAVWAPKLSWPRGRGAATQAIAAPRRSVSVGSLTVR